MRFATISVLVALATAAGTVHAAGYSFGAAQQHAMSVLPSLNPLATARVRDVTSQALNVVPRFHKKSAGVALLQQCEAYEDCAGDEYCDEGNGCWGCEACETLDDAIDGECPPCGEGNTDGPELTLEQALCLLSNAGPCLSGVMSPTGDSIIDTVTSADTANEAVEALEGFCQNCTDATGEFEDIFDTCNITNADAQSVNSHFCSGCKNGFGEKHECERYTDPWTGRIRGPCFKCTWCPDFHLCLLHYQCWAVAHRHDVPAGFRSEKEEAEKLQRIHPGQCCFRFIESPKPKPSSQTFSLEEKETPQAIAEAENGRSIAAADTEGEPIESPEIEPAPAVRDLPVAQPCDQERRKQKRLNEVEQSLMRDRQAAADPAPQAAAGRSNDSIASNGSAANSANIGAPLCIGDIGDHSFRPSAAAQPNSSSSSSSSGAKRGY